MIAQHYGGPDPLAVAGELLDQLLEAAKPGQRVVGARRIREIGHGLRAAVRTAQRDRDLVEQMFPGVESAVGLELDHRHPDRIERRRRLAAQEGANR